MQQVVLPIKDSNVLKEIQDTLLNNFRSCLVSLILLLCQ
ncbi:Truncated integrase domain (plasmid) [Paucilactobacillus oligofermentans DSM 15707 = LMG 22743]|nr:Truncated integrase domain [Paucilactobacillus oligofermentans DSM 15707 = LMG 22743]